MSYNHATMPISLTLYKKLNPDREFIVINLYPVSKEINSINNSAQRLSNNVTLNDSGLTSEIDTASAKTQIPAFIEEHLQNVFNAKKNTEHSLGQKNADDLQGANKERHYVVTDVKNINSKVEEKPIYHVTDDNIEKQEPVDNAAHYTVIGAELNNDELYYAQKYATVGAKAHTYNKIDYATLGEKEEHIYEKIDDYACKEKKAPLNSEQEIDLTKPNDLSSFEKSVFNDVMVNKKSVLEDAPDEQLKKERAKIDELAKQTFAAPKSFISRLASSIWNALFGTKNEAKIMSHDNLVDLTMRTHIGEICNRFNEYVEKGKVPGAFRQQPGAEEYSLTDSKKLVHTFNKDSHQHDHIELSFLIKAYLGHNFTKFKSEELNNVFLVSDENNNIDNKFNELFNNRAEKSTSDSATHNLMIVFRTIANALRLAEGEKKIDELTKESIITSILPSFVDVMYIATHQKEANQVKELIAKYLIENY